MNLCIRFFFAVLVPSLLSAPFWTVFSRSLPSNETLVTVGGWIRVSPPLSTTTDQEVAEANSNGKQSGVARRHASASRVAGFEWTGGD